MKRIQLFVSIVLLSLASLASAQVRQTKLFIDDNTGKFVTLQTTGALTTGRTITFPDAAGEMTIQGNAFNGASQLVQLTGGGAYPALSGAAITSLNGDAVASGLVPLLYGGTHTNLNVTGGAGQVLKQLTVGGDITVATLASGDIPNNAANTSGSAATLTTSRNIWGQAFNGSAAVTGALSGATTIDATGDITTTTGVLITGSAAPATAGTLRIFDGAGASIDVTNDGGVLKAPSMEVTGTMFANTIQPYAAGDIAINPGTTNNITTDGNISVTGGTIAATNSTTVTAAVSGSNTFLTTAADALGGSFSSTGTGSTASDRNVALQLNAANNTGGANSEGNVALNIASGSIAGAADGKFAGVHTIAALDGLNPPTSLAHDYTDGAQLLEIYNPYATASSVVIATIGSNNGGGADPIKQTFGGSGYISVILGGIDVPGVGEKINYIIINP